MEDRILKRHEVDEQYTWDLKAIFSNQEAFEEAYQKLLPLAQNIHQKFKGSMHTAEDIIACVRAIEKLHEEVVLVVTYSSLSVATDQTNGLALQTYMGVQSKMAEINALTSFATIEICQLDDETILKAKSLDDNYAHFLDELLEQKPHLLSSELEETLAALSPVLDAPYFVYNQAKLADLKFESFEFEGKTYPMSFILFEGDWEYEQNTELRRAAFAHFSKSLASYQNTMAAAYQTQIKKEKIISKQRKHQTVFDYLLFEQKVNRELYDRQIDVIMRDLAEPMRKYARLLKRVHNLDKMTYADLKIDLDPNFEPNISVEEAKGYLERALGIFGDEYQQMVSKSFDERWIDFVQNEGKSTGAFCSSPYGSHPYILISWTHRMRECFVLAHELGHAGHFYLANQHQHLVNTRPSLYFIEAPSTMNELLMAEHLIASSDDKRLKRWVLATLISRTYYHNFVTHLLEAAYQREVYRRIDEGQSVVASSLSQIKRSIIEQFWGDEIELSEGCELTWMRQPHYYMGLYPYTYSAGLTIATSFNKLRKEDPSLISAWLEVLKAGGTKSPVELAAMAKVDIQTETALNDTISSIDAMIDEMIRLTDEIEAEQA
jgi:oligoendopeptidase F